ncbi:hypothetical protein PspLS_01366, partial [Pyricularia sp. CBS 133598]
WAASRSFEVAAPVEILRISCLGRASLSTKRKTQTNQSHPKTTPTNGHQARLNASVRLLLAEAVVYIIASRNVQPPMAQTRTGNGTLSLAQTLPHEKPPLPPAASDEAAFAGYAAPAHATRGRHEDDDN